MKKKYLSIKKIKESCLFAIGEIFFVMIGILLALQVNNWNEQRKSKLEEKEILVLMLEDIETDVESLKEQELKHLNFIAVNKQAIQLFNQSNSLQDIREIIALRYFDADELSISKPTFEELINSGKFNIIENKKLRQKIKEHYKKVEEIDYDIRVSNTDKIRLEGNPSYYPIHIMISQSYSEIYDEKFDTDWVANQNSNTYQALKLQLNNSQGLTLIKLSYIEELINRSNNIIEQIEKELELL